MKADLVSFIIPAHTKHSYLVSCLAAVKRQQAPQIQTEVILVDNSCEGLNVAQTDLRFVRCLTAGASHARNAGLAVAKGRWIAFVDSDTVLSDDWLSQLLPRLQACHASAGQGTILTRGSEPDSTFGQFRQLQEEHGKQGLLASEWVLPALNTSACLVDRQAYPQLHFDESIPFAEDVELSWRLIHQGSHRWYFSRCATATSYEPSESFRRFWRRNFHIGRMMKRLCGEFSCSSCDLLQNELFQTERWVKLEFALALKDFTLARAARLIAALSFYAGLITGPTRQRERVRSSGAFTVISDDAIRSIDLTTYKARRGTW